MAIENKLKDELNDPEFDAWFAIQLKKSVVKPPEDFTQKTMESLSSPRIIYPNDPSAIFLIVAIAFVATTLTSILYWFPLNEITVFGLSRVFEWMGNQSNMFYLVFLILTGGTGFFLMDQIISRVILNKHDKVPNNLSGIN